MERSTEPGTISIEKEESAQRERDLARFMPPPSESWIVFQLLDIAHPTPILAGLRVLLGTEVPSEGVSDILSPSQTCYHER